MVKYFIRCNYCNKNIDDWQDNPPVNIYFKEKLIWSYHLRCLDNHFFKKTKIYTKEYKKKFLFFWTINSKKRIKKIIWINKSNPDKKYKIVFIDRLRYIDSGEDW